MINDIHQECRMKFVRALKYDPSGEINFAEVIEPLNICCVDLDGNQQPKLTANRNHPITLQRIIYSMYYGEILISKDC